MRALGRRVGGALAAAVLGIGLAAGEAGAEPAAELPVPHSPLAALAAGLQGPDAAPPGANDWRCTPTAAHPEPVVLVHGLGATMGENWFAVSPALRNAGYCVFALTYGRTSPLPIGGLAPMEHSAAELGAFVGEVLAATGAEKVDIVGHSEGSLMPNHYVKFLGGAQFVDDYVGLTPLWDGTSLAGLPFLEAASRTFGFTPVERAVIDPLCGSCRQFLSGSAFLEKMNSGGGPAVPGVDYTMIMTRLDELVIPYTSGMMDSEHAVNVVIQDACPNDYAAHGGVAWDPVTIQHVLNALDPSTARPPPCRLVLPLLGSR